MSLSIQHLTLQYDQQTVLSDISLEVQPGEFIALLGASGSGKSSLLQAICGLSPITAGQISIARQQVTHQPAHQRPVTIVFQDLRLFPHMTVFENIAFPLKMARIPKGDWPSIVAGVLADVQLSSFEQRRIHQLSGGQQQRIAIARALAAQPQLLLLDEPFSGLDEPLRHEMGHLIKNLHQEKHMTILLVTHDRHEAIQYADRIAFIHQQKLVQFDKAQALIEQPAHPYIAQYFGQYNLIPGQVSNSHFTSGQWTWSVSQKLAAGPYTAMVRSNQIYFDPIPHSQSLHIKGQVKQLIPSDYHLTLHVTAECPLPLWEIQVPQAPPYRLGQDCDFYINPTDLWLIPSN